MRGASHRRGARVIGCGPLRRWVWRLGAWRTDAVTLGGKPLSLEEETRHFKCIGSTGAGKSTAIGELLAGALARGDRAIVADPDGVYLRRLRNEWAGDAEFNPLSPGSVRWSPFHEIERAGDCERLAAALVCPAEDASAEEWRGYARVLLASLLEVCQRTGRPEMGHLWRLLAVADSGELRAMLTGTAAQPFLEPENARMFGSIRAVAVAAVRALQHAQVQRGRRFSVRDWVRSGRGTVFVTYQARQIPALRTLIAGWLSLVITEALSQEEGLDQRLWVVADELDALGAVDGLKEGLARLRKFGGRCVLGFQSIAQVSGTYGKASAQTLVENCGSTLILRCSGSEDGGTSQFGARLIGDRELVKRQFSSGLDHGGGFNSGRRRSSQVSEHLAIEPAVLPAELEQLPDLHGYLKTPSQPVWHRVRLTPGPGNCGSRAQQDRRKPRDG